MQFNSKKESKLAKSKHDPKNFFVQKIQQKTPKTQFYTAKCMFFKTIVIECF